MMPPSPEGAVMSGRLDTVSTATAMLAAHRAAHPALNALVELAIATPLGRPRAGLPIGVHVIGPYLHDRTTLHFATLLEREIGGFVPPPGYE